MGFIVAIDGTAGSGKGTITKIIAEKLNLVSIDTGAMYRCVALECMNKNVDCGNIEGIKEILKNIEIELKNENGKQIVLLNKKDVSKEIRTPEVDALVAKYAAIKEIRDKITPMQRKMGEKVDIIMEGRDIGTVVFPNADVKIFLDCSVEERARRRYNQDIEKGIKTTYEEVLESIKERHKLETEREIAPLVQAEDATYIDSTHMTIEEEANEVIKVIEERKNNVKGM
jgi:cytidylate kinase